MNPFYENISKLLQRDSENNETKSSEFLTAVTQTERDEDLDQRIGSREQGEEDNAAANIEVDEVIPEDTVTENATPSDRTDETFNPAVFTPPRQEDGEQAGETQAVFDSGEPATASNPTAEADEGQEAVQTQGGEETQAVVNSSEPAIASNLIPEPDEGQEAVQTQRGEETQAVFDSGEPATASNLIAESDEGQSAVQTQRGEETQAVFNSGEPATASISTADRDEGQAAVQTQRGIDDGNELELPVEQFQLDSHTPEQIATVTERDVEETTEAVVTTPYGSDIITQSLIPNDLGFDFNEAVEKISNDLNLEIGFDNLSFAEPQIEIPELTPVPSHVFSRADAFGSVTNLRLMDTAQ